MLSLLGMVLAIIILIISIIVGLKIGGIVEDLFYSDIGPLLGFITFAILTSSLSVGLIVITYDKGETYDKLEYSYNIYAMKDNLGVEGNLFYFEDDINYYYLTDYKTRQKMYSINRIDAYIETNNTLSPRIEVYKEYLKPNTGNFLTPYLFTYDRLEYKIIIPEKSIDNKIEIDLE